MYTSRNKLYIFCVHFNWICEYNKRCSKSSTFKDVMVSFNQRFTNFWPRGLRCKLSEIPPKLDTPPPSHFHELMFFKRLWASCLKIPFIDFILGCKNLFKNHPSTFIQNKFRKFVYGVIYSFYVTKSYSVGMHLLNIPSILFLSLAVAMPLPNILCPTFYLSRIHFIFTSRISMWLCYLWKTLFAFTNSFP